MLSSSNGISGLFELLLDIFVSMNILCRKQYKAFLVSWQTNPQRDNNPLNDGPPSSTAPVCRSQTTVYASLVCPGIGEGDMAEYRSDNEIGMFPTEPHQTVSKGTTVMRSPNKWLSHICPHPLEPTHPWIDHLLAFKSKIGLPSRRRLAWGEKLHICITPLQTMMKHASSHTSLIDPSVVKRSLLVMISSSLCCNKIIT